MGRITRILAIGALLGGVFFLYTELIMTMEQTRQWLLNDTPRDAKIARALSESVLIQDCDAQHDALSDELLLAKQGQPRLAQRCEQDAAALRAAVVTAQSTVSENPSAPANTKPQRELLSEQSRTIEVLRAELEQSEAKALAFEEAIAASASKDSQKKRVRPINRNFNLERGTAFYEDRLGLTVPLVSVVTHYDAQVRVQLPGQPFMQQNMSPGTQTTFVHSGAHFSVVLLKTEPESGEADFSLTGRAIDVSD